MKSPTFSTSFSLRSICHRPFRLGLSRPLRVNHYLALLGTAFSDLSEDITPPEAPLEGRS